MSEFTSRFPHQLASFFKRYLAEETIEGMTPLLNKLYNQLLQGHASLQVDSSSNETIKNLKDRNIIGSEKDNCPLVLLITNAVGVAMHLS